MTTADTLARFHAEYQLPRSIHQQRQGEQLRELQRLAAWLDKPLTELTQQDVLTYLGQKLSRGLSPNYVRTQYMMIRSFVTWAHAAALISDEEAGKIRLIGPPRGSSPHAKPNPYSTTEVRRFREILAAKYPLIGEYGPGSRMLMRYLQGKTTVLHGRLYRHVRRIQFEAQVALALELGLRGKEIVELSIEAVHYENDAIAVATAKRGPGVVTYRAVPWTPHAHAAVQEWLDLRSLLNPPHDVLWLALDFPLRSRASQQLRPLEMDQFHTSLRVFGTGWRWHRFRHTAATEWLRAGLPMENVQMLLGHTSAEQTREYTQILKGDIAQAMENAHEKFAKRMGLAA